MSKRSPRNDPIGTIRRDDERDVLTYAIRWSHSSEMGWRVTDLLGNTWLESDPAIKNWMVLYRPAPNERVR